MSSEKDPSRAKIWWHRNVKCKWYRMKQRIVVAFNKRWHRAAFEVFEVVDQYCPVESWHKACKHTKTWAKLKKDEAASAEMYRQKMHGLTIFLLMNGFDKNIIDETIELDRMLGIDVMDQAISNELGQIVMEYIVQAGLVNADEKGLCVWSANAPDQIRACIVEQMAKGVLND